MLRAVPPPDLNEWWLLLQNYAGEQWIGVIVEVEQHKVSDQHSTKRQAQGGARQSHQG